MKKFNFSNFAILLIATLLLGSCSGLKKMKKNAGDIQFKVTPEVVEMHGGNIDIAINAKFPEKYFNKKATLVATPVLKSDKGEKAFKTITLQGEKVQDNNKVINYSGGTVSYNATVPYSDDIRLSELYLKVEASKKSKKVSFDPIKLADGVVSTPILLNSEGGKTTIANDNFKRIIPEAYEADIHYLINSSYVRKDEMKSDDIAKLKDAVKAANEKENYKFKGVKISAYASPDGELDLNDKLAGNRAKTSTKVIGKEMQKLEVAEAEVDAFFKQLSTAEDWEGFKELVSNSNIQDKELILRVLSMYSDPAVREREIKNISAVYKTLANDILPKLRRSKITVNVDVIGKSDQEIADLAKNNASELNVEELLYAATLTNDLKEKNAIYKKATQQFAKCYRGWNDFGMTSYILGDVATAKKAFAKANDLNSKSEIVLNNLGVVALYDKDFEKAEGLFRSAGSADEVKHNIGIVNIKKGNYDQAVKSMGIACDFNLGLAQVLAKDYSAADKTLDCIQNPCAMTYYLKAIIGARQDKGSVMFSNLEKAIKMKAELKEFAKTDVEFGKYFNDDKFKSIVK